MAGTTPRTSQAKRPAPPGLAPDGETERIARAVGRLRGLGRKTENWLASGVRGEAAQASVRSRPAPRRAPPGLIFSRSSFLGLGRANGKRGAPTSGRGSSWGRRHASRTAPLRITSLNLLPHPAPLVAHRFSREAAGFHGRKSEERGEALLRRLDGAGELELEAKEDSCELRERGRARRKDPTCPGRQAGRSRATLRRPIAVGGQSSPRGPFPGRGGSRSTPRAEHTPTVRSTAARPSLRRA
jgi:hypothetical protein